MKKVFNKADLSPSCSPGSNHHKPALGQASHRRRCNSSGDSPLWNVVSPPCNGNAIFPRGAGVILECIDSIQKTFLLHQLLQTFRTLHSYAELPASSSFGVNLEVCRLPNADPFGLQASPTGPAGVWIAGCKQSFNINSTFHSSVRVEQAKVTWRHPPRKYLLCTKSMWQLLRPGVPFREHTGLANKDTT